MALGLNDLSSRAQVGLFTALAALAVAAGWQTLLGPAHREIAAARARLVQLEADIARVQSVAVTLPALDRDVRALELSLTQSTPVQAAGGDPRDILRDLHSLAGDFNLTLTSFKPRVVRSGRQGAEWPVELAVEGGYHDLGYFFDGIAAQAGMTSLMDLQVRTRTGAAAGGSIVASCVVTTYVFRPPNVPVAVVPVEAPLLFETSLTPPSPGYDDGGRRDPFVSVMPAGRLAGPAVGGSRGRSGLAAISVADVAVRGIARNGNTRLAILEGPGRQSFVVGPGNRLLDGVVRTIDANGVVFVPATGAPDAVRKALRSTREDAR